MNELRELLATRGTRSDTLVMHALREGLAGEPERSGPAAWKAGRSTAWSGKPMRWRSRMDRPTARRRPAHARSMSWWRAAAPSPRCCRPAALPGDASRWVVPLEGPPAGAVLLSNDDVPEHSFLLYPEGYVEDRGDDRGGDSGDRHTGTAVGSEGPPPGPPPGPPQTAPDAAKPR